MKTTLLWILVGLNCLLLAFFVGYFIKDNAAIAQRITRPSDYLLIPGEVTGGTSGVVYIIDTPNAALGAMAFNDSRKSLDVMQPIDLTRVFEAALQGQGNNRPGTRR